MHRRRVLALGLAVLLVLGGASAPIAAVGALSPATATDHANRPANQSTTQTQGGNATRSTLDAMEVVQNQTNGTVVGVRRRTQGRNGTIETLSYVVFVLEGNESAENADGSGVTILVAARKDQGGIISVERNDG
ncbi:MULTISPECIES: hypothetical protein [Halorussus]|uniref:hypothetical protein n=1 Tax=Halorussus TaxID=1070314 RepID=UPI000E215016|nr:MULTISPECIES: hypothetical protein [Halorussus]NHN58849.1 hypothetical protein [Halorussus sp. JP-T4]